MEKNKIKVLIVDDSALMRKFIADILCKDPDFEIVGTAMDGEIALQKVAKLKPDVITMDVEMPRMDGLDALERIMREHPTPVLMLSSTTQKGALTTLDALEMGAVDFITKPSASSPMEIYNVSEKVRRMVKSVANARVKQLTGPVRKRKSRAVQQLPPTVRIKRADPGEPVSLRLPATGVSIVAIGASTGGPEVLTNILKAFPANFPSGVLVVQHMPEGFTRTFAERLDQICDIEVREARHGDIVRPGLALIAPGNYHMIVKRKSLATIVEINQKEKVNGHRPAVDPMFMSVAEEFGKHSAAAILTGMGRDGVDGIKEIYNKGGLTLAQSEKTCVVFGMPKEAIKENCIREILSPESIAKRLISAVGAKPRAEIELNIIEDVSSGV